MNPHPTYAAHVNLSDIEDETDAFAIFAAYEYQRIQEEEPQSSFRLTRNPISRERELAEECLKSDYFNQDCKYPHRDFRARFRMSRKLFSEIVSGIESYTADPFPDHFAYFSQAPDCTGRMSISVLMKCTMAIRQLAYGNSPDAFDEYLQMSARTGRNCLDNFNMCVIEIASARKDVERAFGVLQGRWGIIRQPARAYQVNRILRIMYSCIILHNMILKDQKYALSDYKALFRNPARLMQDRWIDRCDRRRRKIKEIRDKDVHLNLQQQLMEHIWREREGFMEVDDDD